MKKITEQIEELTDMYFYQQNKEMSIVDLEEEIIKLIEKRDQFLVSEEPEVPLTIAGVKQRMEESL